MKRYYICRHCGEINYDTSTEQTAPWSMVYYSECKKCGEITPWAPTNEGTEFTEEEIVNSIKYINKKVKKIREKAIHKSDLPIKKQNILTTLDVIGTFLDSALYEQFRIDRTKESQRGEKIENKK